MRYSATLSPWLVLLLALYGCGGPSSVRDWPPELKPIAPETVEAMRRQQAIAQYEQRIAAAQSVRSEMACRELKRDESEPRAFFGFFWDTCLDPFGKPFVYVTAFDTLRSRDPSPAEGAGLKILDRVVGINGCFVETGEYFNKKLLNATAMNVATIKVIRGPGNTQEVVSIMTEKLNKGSRSRGKSKSCKDINLKPAPSR